MDSKILVVDDNAVNRKLLTTILGREGYVSLEADCGASALRIAKTESPDVILLDIMMPDMDGFKVCQELRQMPAFEDVPVLFLSALTEVKERIKGFDAGANDYITKPYHQAEVLARVRRCLSIRRRAQRHKLRSSRIEISEQKLRESHDSAARQQRGLLPAEGAGDGVFECAWWQVAPDGICGEMFGLQRLGAGVVSAHLFDAGGNGLAAATMAMTLTKLLTPRAGGFLMPRPGEPAEPAQVLGALDRSLGLKGIDTFFSMQALLMDAASGALKYASVGGKPYPLLLRQRGASAWLAGEREPLIDGGEGFYHGQVQLEKGDRVFLMSGGVSMAGAAKPFGEARVESLLLSTFGHDLADSVAAVESTLQAYSSEVGPCSLMGLEFLGPRKRL